MTIQNFSQNHHLDLLFFSKLCLLASSSLCGSGASLKTVDSKKKSSRLPFLAWRLNIPCIEDSPLNSPRQDANPASGLSWTASQEIIPSREKFKEYLTWGYPLRNKFREITRPSEKVKTSSSFAPPPAKGFK